MNTEYFSNPAYEPCISRNGVMKVIQFDDYDIINELLGIFAANYPQAYQALKEEYGGKAHARWHMFSRFVRCNFSALDHVDDVDEQNMLHFEKVACPMRGECPHECIICLPEFNTTLTAREFEILAMIVEGLTDAQIADRICRSFDTVRNHRKNIEHKLKCNSKVKLVEYARKNNLI